MPATGYRRFERTTKKINEMMPHYISDIQTKIDQHQRVLDMPYCIPRQRLQQHIARLKKHKNHCEQILKFK